GNGSVSLLEDHPRVRIVWVVSGCGSPEDSDPVVSAENREYARRREEVLARLQPHLRMVWEQMRAGATAREVAVKAGIHYEKARRCWGMMAGAGEVKGKGEKRPSREEFP